MEEIIKGILEKEKIRYKKITKATSGFTSLVYFIDDKFVIKLSNDAEKIKKIDKEISIYKHLEFDFIPKFITSGECNNYHYLIISKLQGKSLYQIWHTLNDKERENIVKQVANILREFHKVDGTFLDDEYKDNDWKEKLTNDLLVKIDKLDQFGVDTTKLRQFVLDNAKIFDNNTYGLVYNDAHLDNFIYHNGKVYLIDFDRTRYCPIDYEMMIFKCMCDNPSKFASEEDEDNIKDEDYKNVYDWLKKYYSVMFEIPYIEQRIKFYQYDYLINQAIKCKDIDWIEEENSKLFTL